MTTLSRSLDGEGEAHGTLAEPRSVLLVSCPSAERLLMWPQNEVHLNESVVMELHERVQVEAHNNGRHPQFHDILPFLRCMLVRCIHSTSQSGI